MAVLSSFEAVVVYSFGGSPRYGPGAANKKLAAIALRIAQNNPSGLVLVAQDYLEEPLREFGGISLVGLVVRKHRTKGAFLGTEEVTAQAVAYLHTQGIRRVVLVAHPFLHRFKCRKLLLRSGFSVKCAKTGFVPFDPGGEGWWVRGPLRLLLYAVLQVLFGRRGV